MALGNPFRGYFVAHAVDTHEEFDGLIIRFCFCVFETEKTTGVDYFFDFFGDALADFGDYDCFVVGADEGWLVFELAACLEVGAGSPLVADSFVVVFHSGKDFDCAFVGVGSVGGGSACHALEIA